jgi:hypothetical protein
MRLWMQSFASEDDGEDEWLRGTLLKKDVINALTLHFYMVTMMMESLRIVSSCKPMVN